MERISNKRHRDVYGTVERMKNERKEPWKGFVEAVNGELCQTNVEFELVKKFGGQVT